MNAKAWIFAALIISAAFAANMHLVQYRLDPAPKAYTDFDLYLTFKNDVSHSADGISINLACPDDLECANITATIPSYGIQEFRIPIKSNSSGGLKEIKVLWEDGSYNYYYNTTTNSTATERQVFSATIPFKVGDSALSGVAFSGDLFHNENNTLSISFNASSLNNVQVSLYSACMSFTNPLFYYPSLDGQADISTPAFVNCAEGNSQINFVLSSDELSYSVPISVRIQKRPHAVLNITPISANCTLGKCFYRAQVSNSGAAAEKLSLQLGHSPAINSPDVLYLGDFKGGKEVVFQLESDKAGDYPIQVQADWTEGKETYSQVFDENVKISDSGIGILPIAVIACVAALLAFWKLL
jgi:hypothetical protein